MSSTVKAILATIAVFVGIFLVALFVIYAPLLYKVIVFNTFIIAVVFMLFKTIFDEEKKRYTHFDSQRRKAMPGYKEDVNTDKPCGRCENVYISKYIPETPCSWCCKFDMAVCNTIGTCPDWKAQEDY